MVLCDVLPSRVLVGDLEDLVELREGLGWHPVGLEPCQDGNRYIQRLPGAKQRMGGTSLASVAHLSVPDRPVGVAA